MPTFAPSLIGSVYSVVEGVLVLVGGMVDEVVVEEGVVVNSAKEF